jgi:hypothetical protein
VVLTDRLFAALCQVREALVKVGIVFFFSSSSFSSRSFGFAQTGFVLVLYEVPAPYQLYPALPDGSFIQLAKCLQESPGRLTR